MKPLFGLRSVTGLVLALALASIPNSVTGAYASSPESGLVPPSTSSSASSAGVQAEIDDILKDFGGQQTAWNEVSWDEGSIRLTIAAEPLSVISAGPTALQSRSSMSPATLAATVPDNCAAGTYCVYSRANYGGNRLTYSTCPATHASFTALLGKVRSIKNDRTIGAVRAYEGAAIKATLGARTGTTNITGVTKVTCR